MAIVYEVKWSFKQRFSKEETETVVVLAGTDYDEMVALCAYMQHKNPGEYYYLDSTVVSTDHVERVRGGSTNDHTV